EAEQLRSSELATRFTLADPRVRDKLDDVAGRILEVARPRLPILEGKHHVARLAGRQQLCASADPLESSVEPVPGHEQRKVVEGLAAGWYELELRLADREPAVPAVADPESARVEAFEPAQSLSRCEQPDTLEMHATILASWTGSSETIRLCFAYAPRT